MSETCPDALKVLESAVESCVGCGFCLEACPTYLELGNEADSPRGRIALVDALMNELLEVTPKAVRHLDLCLGCRACEAACPSGVPYGAILEQSRDWLRKRPGRRKTAGDRVLEFALSYVLPKPWVLKILTLGLTLSHKLGLIRLAKRLPLPKRLKDLLSLAPEVDGPAYKAKDRLPKGDSKEKSALFLGCVQRHLFPAVHESTAALLQA
ncbi:MAG: 4Fe-4S dicluster domain-containing protein, partial [Planctomycetota bacterium]|nr:4Fe-4S dicluster domain-containing protein [Planctomycetota bacterium]